MAIFPINLQNLDKFEKVLKPYVKAIGLVSVLIISLIDYLIVIDLSLSILYLFPICLTSWYKEKKFSFLLVLLSSFGWLIAESEAKTNLNFILLLWNTSVRLIVFLTVAYLLSELKIAYEKEKYLAQTDVLTDIVNRRFFLEILQRECKRSHRYKHCLTLVYFDLDNFKEINDRFGHNTGDKLLKIISQNIQQQIRETDTIARLGGDEFALLFPETNYEASQAMLSRLHQKLVKAIKAYSPRVSMSVGAVTFLSLPDSVEQMLEQVDRLMYQVKNNGKNRIEHQIFHNSCSSP